MMLLSFLLFTLGIYLFFKVGFGIANWFFYTDDTEIDRKITKIAKFIGGDTNEKS